MSNERQYSTFTVDRYLFAVSTVVVQEVLRPQPMTPVPLAPSSVRGLVNLRGQVVTAVDLRRRLGLPPAEDAPPSMNLIVRTDDGPVSLLVDTIGDVLEVDADRLEVAPMVVDGLDPTMLLGVFQLDGQLLLLLDVEQATAADEPVTADR
jgi:purine-binding chemotaxis protein CheW